MVKLYIQISSIVGMIIWFFVGFVIWVPILLIGASNYCFDIMRASLNGTSIDSDVIIALRNKTDMYSRGFRNFELIIKSYSMKNESN